MELESLTGVYHSQLKDLRSVEKQLSGALKKLADGASDERLKRVFTEHQAQTERQLERIEELIKSAGVSSARHKCRGIAGIIEEAKPHLKAQGDPAARDAALIADAQRAEHYEIAGYGTAAALAGQLERTDDQRVLKEILEEEKEADRRLSELATGDVNPDAAADGAGARSETGITTSKGREHMPRRNDDYGYERDRDQGRSGGRSSTMYRERDEEGRFTSRDDDDYRSSRRGASGYGGYGGSRSDEDDGRYEGRSRAGQHSASMQGRDEYGRFTGDEDDGYSSRSGGRYSSRSRYSDEDDDGRSGGYGGGRGYSDSAGRHYSRESWERAQEGRSMGGQHSHGGGRGFDGSDYDDDGGRYQSRSRGSSRSMPDRDEYGRFVSDDDGGNSSRSGARYSSRSRSDDEEDGRSGGYGGGRGYTDSAGRHYTRESWERAQEGRSMGGQHSHGGRR